MRGSGTGVFFDLAACGVDWAEKLRVSDGDLGTGGGGMVISENFGGFKDNKYASRAGYAIKGAVGWNKASELSSVDRSADVSDRFVPSGVPPAYLW